MNEMFQLEGTTLRIILPQELDHPMADLIRKGTEMIAVRTYIRTILFVGCTCSLLCVIVFIYSCFY